MTGKLLLYLLTLWPVCNLIARPSLDNNSHRPYNKRFAEKRISKRDDASCQINEQYPFNTSTGIICCSSCNPGSVAENIGCTKTDPITKCKNCTEGKEYMDKLNHKTKCLRCNDCDKEHGLEVETPCTAKQNVKCKCRPGYFCNAPPCQHCDPCDTCGNGAVLEKCTETQNTNCQRRGRVHWYMALSILPVIVFAVSVTFLIYKRTYITYLEFIQEEGNTSMTNISPPGVENNEMEPMHTERNASMTDINLLGDENNEMESMLPERNTSMTDINLLGDENNEMELMLPDIDLTPCIPDIAEEMKLEEVKAFVRKLHVSTVRIDTVMNNNNNDVTEQKIKLLECWYQETGIKGAFKTLITTLNSLNFRVIADKIQQKIKPEATNSPAIHENN